MQQTDHLFGLIILTLIMLIGTEANLITTLTAKVCKKYIKSLSRIKNIKLISYENFLERFIAFFVWFIIFKNIFHQTKVKKVQFLFKKEIVQNNIYKICTKNVNKFSQKFFLVEKKTIYDGRLRQLVLGFG